MSHKQRGLFAVAILLTGSMLVSACTQSLSSPPVGTPSLIPTGLFVAALPSAQNPMALIEEFAKETAAAQTVIASGGTPIAPSTPNTSVTGTVITPQTGVTSTSTPPIIGTPSTPTNAIPITPVVVTPTFTPGGPTLTPGVRPSTYTLHNDEFPFCIARRFNVDPAELLSASHLTSPDIYYEGLSLTIPQNSSWPVESGPRALHTHPDTYTVTGNSDTTVYGVACKYGDVDPSAIAQTNGISVSSALTVGKQLKIP